MKIQMETVEGEPLKRLLLKEHPCRMPYGRTDMIPVGFVWDGSSIFWLVARVFPRWRHPRASLEHDWGCAHSRNDHDRLWHDKKFRKNVRLTSWRVTSWLGWCGVRIGAAFGIGSKF